MPSRAPIGSLRTSARPPARGLNGVSVSIALSGMGAVAIGLNLGTGSWSNAGAPPPTLAMPNIGAPGFKDTVRETGLDPLEGEAARQADAVLVSGHRDFDYEELLTATLALQGGAALFATSHDPTLPMPGGAWPGTGAILAAVETASAETAEIGGKPERHLFERACALISGADRVAMVGDRLASDIEGGHRAGLETVLVLSGASSRAEAEAADPRPDHTIEGLAGLLS